MMTGPSFTAKGKAAKRYFTRDNPQCKWTFGDERLKPCATDT